MAVLRLPSHRRPQGDEQQKKPAHSRRLSGVLSSFLDAFRCRVDASSSSSSNAEQERKSSKGRPRLKLRQILFEGKGEEPASKQEVCQRPEPDADKVMVVGVRDLVSRPDHPGGPHQAAQEEEEEMKRKRTRLRWLVEGMESGRERARVAMEVRRMTRDSAENRLVLAELGVIPLLLELLGSTSPCSSACKQPLLALLNLAIGNNRNKQCIVEGGAVPLLLRVLSSATSSELIDSATAALLSLSALDSNKAIIGQSGAVEQLVRLVVPGEGSNNTTARDSIRVLYNLSISSANVGRMVADGVPQALLNFLATKQGTDPVVADRILATLGNLAESSEEARKCATSSDTMAKLLAALASYTAAMETSTSSSSSSSSSSSTSTLSSSSEEEASSSCSSHSHRVEYASRCQERVLYLLMLLSYHSWPARQAMVSAGAVTSLLEVALLGSAIAQRRAGRILDCLREERFQRNMVSRPMSAPLSLSLPTVVQAPPSTTASSLYEERRAVNWMVRQSLERNMEKMVRRARLPSEDLDASSRVPVAISSRLNRSFGNSASSKAMLA